jgi:hypothetical protein
MHVIEDLEKAIEAADKELEESKMVISKKEKHVIIPSKPTAAFGTSKRNEVLKKREYSTDMINSEPSEAAKRVLGGAFSRSQRFRETKEEMPQGIIVPNYDFVKKRTKVAHITRYNLPNK